jgi:hypothetical protein
MQEKYSRKQQRTTENQEESRGKQEEIERNGERKKQLETLTPQA